MKHKLTPAQLTALECCPWFTDRERTVLDLFYRRGWRIEDIAAALGLAGSDGELDVDAAGEALKASARKHGKIEVDIPLMGISYTFSEKDVETLLSCIRKAGGK